MSLFKEFQTRYNENEVEAGINPTGTIISFMGNNAPTGYLKCDGTEYNITDYPILAAHFEKEFGTKNNFGGDGTTTFAVPDLRGEFLRGTGTNSYTYGGAGASVGTHQNPTRQPYLIPDLNLNLVYAGPSSVDDPDSWAGNVGYDNWASRYGSNSYTRYTHFTARPTNTAVLYCIKY